MNKEHPILFSGPMVMAILDGRKTQTRRIVKNVESGWRPMTPEEWMAPTPNRPAIGGYPKHSAMFWTGAGGGVAYPCPYGKPGDRLWVRETWRPISVCHQQWVNVLYAVDEAQRECAYFPIRLSGHHWHPSIYMPRRASRITLEVTGVRAERLQEISEEDAKAEGIAPWKNGGWCAGDIHDGHGPQPVAAYRVLWDSLNAKRGHGWDTDPWVWVVEFRCAS